MGFELVAVQIRCIHAYPFRYVTVGVISEPLGQT